MASSSRDVDRVLPIARAIRLRSHQVQLLSKVCCWQASWSSGRELLDPIVARVSNIQATLAVDGRILWAAGVSGGHCVGGA